MTSRQFVKRIKQNIPKGIDALFEMSNKENKFIRVVKGSKKSAIAEHLVNDSDFASSYNLKKFRIIKNFLAYLI